MRNKKGFTMAELLIVVAIVAVLVAVSVPVFANQLEKARESTDLANVRSAYAELMTEVNNDVSGNSDTIYMRTVPLKQKEDDWQRTGTLNVGGVSQDDGEHWLGKEPKKGGVCEVSYTAEKGVVLDWRNKAKHSYTMLNDFITKNEAKINAAVAAKKGYICYIVQDKKGIYRYVDTINSAAGSNVTEAPEGTVAYVYTGDGIDFYYSNIDGSKAFTWKKEEGKKWDEDSLPELNG